MEILCQLTDLSLEFGNFDNLASAQSRMKIYIVLSLCIASGLQNFLPLKTSNLLEISTLEQAFKF